MNDGAVVVVVLICYRNKLSPYGSFKGVLEEGQISFHGKSNSHSMHMLVHNLLTLFRQRFFLRKTNFLPLKRFFKCYVAKCH